FLPPQFPRPIGSRNLVNAMRRQSIARGNLSGTLTPSKRANYSPIPLCVELGHGSDGHSTRAVIRILQLEQNALHAWSHVLHVETKFSAHLQHGRVFGEDISIDAPKMLSFSVIDDVLHQHPTETVPL